MSETGTSRGKPATGSSGSASGGSPGAAKTPLSKGPANGSATKPTAASAPAKPAGKPAATSSPAKSAPAKSEPRPGDTQPVRTQQRPAAAVSTTKPAASAAPTAPAKAPPSQAQPATPQGRQPVSPQPARPAVGVQPTTDQPAAAATTGTRAPLKERVGAKLSQAAVEHKANASAEGAAAAAAAKPNKPQPRRARLRLTRVDPWSVMKVSFLLSIAFAIVTVVAVTIVWGTLGAAGVWDSINASVQSVIGQESQDFDVTDYVGMSRIMGFTMLVAVIDVILITALATLGAFLYNMSAALLGGLEVTLAEDPR